MIAIITEKPSVGLDIARIVGANEKRNGYMQGGDYLVTWALGHLVGLALPSFYGQERPSADSLPLIPEPFKLTIRQRKTEKGYGADPAAAKQLSVIDSVLSRSSSVIVATDAGREGELIYRYIHAHLGCVLPIQRLWISSLTDEAIRTGLADLRDGKQYDNLYAAADCRAKADWLVGINASQALAVASGVGNNSLGRVQTPTLALICSRWLEHRGFLPSDYWTLHITLEKEGLFRQFRYTGDIGDEAECKRLEPLIAPGTAVHITKSGEKEAHQLQPLLYDLTALQKDCNVHLDLSAEQTLAAAQALYERKLITYPRTGSRYIPNDVFSTVPALLRSALALPQFVHLNRPDEWDKPSTRSVDKAKVTDHHALLITGNHPSGLSETEEKIYVMIAGRMLEAFGQKCVRNVRNYTAEVGELEFISRTATIVRRGWREVFGREEDQDEDETDRNERQADFTQGEEYPLSGHSFGKMKTRPKPLYTEATLLSAMENCGRDVADESARKAMKECGIGTPATRAAIISTLFKREYIERSAKSLVPTEKGLFIYKAVKDMRIADPQLTGDWEKTLADIEAGKMASDSFLEAIKIYTRQITREILSLDFAGAGGGPVVACPKCGEGRIAFRHKVAKCNNEKCGLLVFRRFLNKELTDRHLEQLFSSGTTKLIKGFKGKRGVAFDAQLTFDGNFNVTFAEKKQLKGVSAKRHAVKARLRSGKK